LKDLFVDELLDLYDAENQITDALPKLIDKAQYQQLKSARQEYLEVTRGQIRRLESIFQRLGEKPQWRKLRRFTGEKEFASLLQQTLDVRRKLTRVLQKSRKLLMRRLALHSRLLFSDASRVSWGFFFFLSRWMRPPCTSDR